MILFWLDSENIADDSIEFYQNFLNRISVASIECALIAPSGLASEIDFSGVRICVELSAFNKQFQGSFSRRAIRDVRTAIFKRLVDKKKKIVSVYLNKGLGISKSGFLEFSFSMSREFRLEFLWITKSPFKGRFAIYSDIFFSDPLINSMDAEKCSFEADGLDIFRAQYFLLKKTIHNPVLFQSSKKKLPRKWKTAFSLLINFALIFGNAIKSFLFKIRGGRKWLYLCTKADHWYTRYANPELLDQCDIVEQLSKGLPLNMRLEVRLHPRGQNITKLLWKCLRLPHVCVSREQEFERAVTSAELVFHRGSTSGVEAMLAGGDVVEIGRRPLLIGGYPGVYRNIDTVRGIKCLNDIEDEVDANVARVALVRKILRSSFPFCDFQDFSVDPVDSILFDRIVFALKTI